MQRHNTVVVMDNKYFIALVSVHIAVIALVGCIFTRLRLMKIPPTRAIMVYILTHNWYGTKAYPLQLNFILQNIYLAKCQTAYSIVLWMQSEGVANIYWTKTKIWKQFLLCTHSYRLLAQLQLVSLHSVGSQPAVSAGFPPAWEKNNT